MNDLLNTLYTTMLDQYTDPYCDELYERIQQEMPRTVYMRIEPMLNEVVDRAMEWAFKEGYRMKKWP